MNDAPPPVHPKTSTDSYLGDLLFWGLLCGVGYLLFLGATPLFDWDEINFAECAREMIVSDNYLQVQVNFQPFWEKPPLFIWMQVLSMKIFGVNEFAARFPNACIGVLTILTLYICGAKWKGRIFGRILAALYTGTLLPVIYFKTGIIDPVFNFFIFLALFQLLELEMQGQQHPESKAKNPRAMWIGLWMGLAVLTKGPAALVIIGLTYGIYKLFTDKLRIPFLPLLKALLVFCITVFAWYGVEILQHGTWFMDKFLRYQIQLLTEPVAGHEQPFYYHFIVFLIGCFPLSAFTFRAMFARYNTIFDIHTHRFMLIWFWVVMIVFSLSSTKIIHYSSLLYFPAAFLSALFLWHKIQNKEAMTWDVFAIFILGVIFWGVFPSCINLIVNHLDMILPYIGDKFARGNLSMEVEWTGWEWLVGAVFLKGLLTNFRHLRQKKYLHFLYFQVILTLFFVTLQFKVLVPRITRYTQGAAQDFYTNLVGKDVYYLPADYHTYLPLFYGKVKPQANPNAYNKDWLLNADTDKPVYLSTKNILIEQGLQSRLPQFEKLYEKGGFVFYRKKEQTP